MERPTCGTCVYWDGAMLPPGDNEDGTRDSGWTDLSFGTCHRHAPRPGNTEESVDEAWWPQTYNDDFCGAHPRFDAYIAATRDDCAREHQP